MPESPSREQILEAAQRLFAAQGFSATTIKQIGRAARVNTALLYYYFDDKERLYRAVLQRLMSGLVSRTLVPLESDAPPAVRMRGFIQAQVHTFMANPELPRLFMREMLDHGVAHAVDQIQHLAATSFKGLCDTIREGQRQGTFRTDIQPEFAAISSVAQVVYFFLARPAVRVLLGKEISTATVEAFARHVADFTLAALTSGIDVAPKPRPRRRS